MGKYGFENSDESLSSLYMQPLCNTLWQSMTQFSGKINPMLLTEQRMH